jgi:tripartite-type tricarboxylate transporter receptor subunit TctC
MKKLGFFDHFPGSPMFVVTLFLLGALSIGSNGLSAEYPSKPIEYVTHSSPGGPNGIIGVLIAEIVMKEKVLPQPVFTTLKSGSGMANAFSYLMEKKGEDHIMGATTNNLILGTPLRVKVPYNFKTFTPIANLCVDGSVMIVSAKGPYKTIGDVLEAAKKNPNKLAQGGSSIVSPESMMGKVMQKMKGVQWKFVSFSQEMEAATNVMSGNIDFAFMNPVGVVDHVRAGTLRVVLSASTRRYKAFPDVPTVEEAGLGKSLISYRCLIGPPDMPQYAQNTLEAAAKKIVDSGIFKKYMEQSMQHEEYMTAKQIYALFEQEEGQVKQQMIDGGMLNKDGSIIQK